MRMMRLRIVAAAAMVFGVTAIWLHPRPVVAQWHGTDVTVVEKVAKEAGREPKDPLINTDQGDLLLFVFLLAGAGGGFVAGYCYRKLFGAKGADAS